MFISTVAKTLSKIAKLTLMVRFINRTGSSRTEFPTQIPKLHKHNLYVLYAPSSQKTVDILQMLRYP